MTMGKVVQPDTALDYRDDSVSHLKPLRSDM